MANNTSLKSKLDAFKDKHPLISAIVGIGVTGLVIVWILQIFLHFWTHHGDNATVPDIRQMSYAEAMSTLRKSDLDIAISDSIYDTSVAPGTVVESWPKAGSTVKAGRSVYVTVTAFSPKSVTITMPVTGVSSRQTMSYLKALGVTNVRIVSVPSQYDNLVIAAKADGRPLGVGSIIPVNAHIVLEVGQYVEADAATDSISAEDAILDDLMQSSEDMSNTSTYEGE